MSEHSAIVCVRFSERQQLFDKIQIQCGNGINNIDIVDIENLTAGEVIDVDNCGCVKRFIGASSCWWSAIVSTVFGSAGSAQPSPALDRFCAHRDNGVPLVVLFDCATTTNVDDVLAAVVVQHAATPNSAYGYALRAASLCVCCDDAATFRYACAKSQTLSNVTCVLSNDNKLLSIDGAFLAKGRAHWREPFVASRCIDGRLQAAIHDVFADLQKTALDSSDAAVLDRLRDDVRAPSFGSLGFQSESPLTDFRGMERTKGALNWMLFVAERYGTEWRDAVVLSNNLVPFALVLLRVYSTLVCAIRASESAVLVNVLHTIDYSIARASVVDETKMLQRLVFSALAARLFAYVSKLKLSTAPSSLSDGLTTAALEQLVRKGL